MGGILVAKGMVRFDIPMWPSITIPSRPIYVLICTGTGYSFKAAIVKIILVVVSEGKDSDTGY